MRTALTLLLACLAAPTARGDDAPPPDALHVQLARPGEQMRRVIDLFRGAKASSPAAALAAWKHATRGEKSLGKATEALIALFNPAMVDELKSADGAELFLGFDPDTHKTGWRAFLPHDDGSFAAIAPAQALTDGQIDEPLDGRPVFRLGGPGSALSSRSGDRLAFASTRTGLKRALEQPPRPAPDRSGTHMRLDPAGLRPAPDAILRQLAIAFDALGARDATAWAGLEGTTLGLDGEIQHTPMPADPPRLDPAWLHVIPAEAAAVVAFSLPADEPTRSHLFQVLDRADRSTPERATLAPLRTRLNLVAATQGINLEADLWPNLAGVSAAVFADAKRQPQSLLVVLHAVDEKAAKNLHQRVVARAVGKVVQQKPAPETAEGEIRVYGEVGGVVVASTFRGPRVFLQYGLDARLPAALNGPAPSVEPILTADWVEGPPNRLAAVWPGRLVPVGQMEPALDQALALAPPVVWLGFTEKSASRDHVRWTGLDALVKRVLDRLPLDPPPDR